MRLETIVTETEMRESRSKMIGTIHGRSERKHFGASR
jgi:hypothetical protein